MKISNPMLWIVLTAGFSLTAIPLHAQPVDLEKLGAIQGIVIAPKDPSSLYLATNTGLYLTTPDKQVELLSHHNDNLISLAAAHDKTGTLYTSGYPSNGGNLGLLRSQDYGRTWEQHPTNSDGPMAIMNLTVSRSDPNTMYGVYQGLRVSHDGGKTWLKVAATPQGLLSLAVSGSDVSLLYAATQRGLYVSHDGGRSWDDPYQLQLPVTMVRTTADNSIYAFIVSKGLQRTSESAIAWQALPHQFGMQVLRDLVVVPDNPQRMFALNQFGRLLTSVDTGESWHRFTGDPKPLTAVAKHGEKLYTAHCQACHGLQGVGENYSRESLSTKNYLMAPSLDDSTHAWHHSDDDLVKTILNGSPRNGRMPGWKSVLSEQDARDIVVYIKGLWGQRALDCQGPKHMSCM